MGTITDPYAVTVNDLIDEWKGLTNWSQGIDEYPTDDGTPTISQLLDYLWEGELRALEVYPELRQEKQTITTVADRCEYGIFDSGAAVVRIWGQRHANALITISTDNRRPLRWISYNEMLRRRNTAEEATGTGRPREVAIRPDNSGLVFWPTPEAAYTIHIIYILRPQMFAVKENQTWFLKDASCDGTTYTEDDFLHDFIDRPRLLVLKGSGGTTMLGTVFTVVGTDSDGVEQTEYLVTDGGDARIPKIGEKLFKTVTSVASPVVSGETFSLGIASVFSSSSAEDVTYFLASASFDGETRYPASFRNTAIDRPRKLLVQGSPYLEELLGATIVVVGKDKNGAAQTETIALWDGTYNPTANPVQDASRLVYGSEYFSAVSSITPESISDAFPDWADTTAYAVGEIVTATSKNHGTGSYACVVAHTSNVIDDFDEDFEKNYWTKLSVAGPVCNVGISDLLSPEWADYEAYTHLSMLPYSWARRLGPRWAAHRYFERIGDFDRSNRFRAAFDEELERFGKEVRVNPDRKYNIFKR